MTRKEALREIELFDALRALGFTSVEATALRRISLQLRRWHDLECGTEWGGVERDEATGKCFSYSVLTGERSAYPDLESGALKRLQKIFDARNLREKGRGSELSPFVQGDPRGCALYVLRPGDVPEGKSADAYYSRGIAIY